MLNEDVKKYDPNNPMSTNHKFIRNEINLLELTLPYRLFGDLGTPSIDNQLLKIKGRKIWITIDKPYYPVSPCQDINIIPSAYSLTAIRLNSPTNPLIPIDFGVPLEVEFDRIYFTTYLSKPYYLDSANFPDFETTKIRIYYTDNPQVDLNWTLRPKMFRISQLVEDIGQSPTTLFMPWVSMPYLKLIHGFLIPLDDSYRAMASHNLGTLQLIDDNMENINNQVEPNSLYQIPILWQDEDFEGTLYNTKAHDFRFKIPNLTSILSKEDTRANIQDDYYSWHIRRLEIGTTDVEDYPHSLIIIKGEIV